MLKSCLIFGTLRYFREAKKCGQHGLPALQNESPSRNVYTNSLSEIEVRTSFSAFSIAVII